MISISITTAVWIYLSFFLSILTFIWLLHYLKNREKNKVSPYKAMRICHYCHFPYLELSNKEISKCPQCQCFNK